MTNKVKAIIAIIIIGSSLTACIHQIDQSVIQTFITENTTLMGNVSEMKSFKYKVLSEKENKYSEMIASIEPKKKLAYEKDKALKTELKNINETIETSTKEFENNYNTLAKTIESNASFIITIPDSEKDEDEIKSEWQQNMVVSNEIIETNNSLQKEISELSEKYSIAIKKAIKKYGKTEKVKYKLNKNK